jgi:CheY-like chemotaxis protein
MKALIIDDEPDFRTYLATILTEHGHEVTQARDGPEGLELAASLKPDLITLDVLMPDQSGIKVYRELRKDPDLQKIPIVLVTGVAKVAPAFQDFERFISSRRIPAPDGFLEKPIQPEALIELVDRLTSA